MVVSLAERLGKVGRDLSDDGLHTTAFRIPAREERTRHINPRFRYVTFEVSDHPGCEFAIYDAERAHPVLLGEHISAEASAFRRAKNRFSVFSPFEPGAVL